jgi:hypothetical protein
MKQFDRASVKVHDIPQALDVSVVVYDIKIDYQTDKVTVNYSTFLKGSSTLLFSGFREFPIEALGTSMLNGLDAVMSATIDSLYKAAEAS